MGLKAVIFSTETKLDKSQAEQKTSQLRRKHALTKVAESSSKRMKSDVSAEETEDDRVYRNLVAKAQLYEKLKNNELSSDSKSESLLLENSLLVSDKSTSSEVFLSSGDVIAESVNSSSGGPSDLPFENSRDEIKHMASNSSSRVKSQWERNVHAKRHLESVHEAVELERETRLDSGMSGINNGSLEASDNIPEPKSMREVRREMLLKKQKMFHSSS